MSPRLRFFRLLVILAVLQTILPHRLMKTSRKQSNPSDLCLKRSHCETNNYTIYYYLTPKKTNNHISYDIIGTGHTS